MSLVHDPWRPVPAIGGHLSDVPGEANRFNLDIRPDVAVFTSAPISEDLRLEGTPVLSLETNCDRESFDLFVALSIIPTVNKNIVTQISTGVLRITHNDQEKKSFRKIKLQPYLKYMIKYHYINEFLAHNRPPAFITKLFFKQQISLV